MVIMAWKAGITMLAQAEEPVEWVYFIMENAPSGLDKLKKPVDKILGRREPAALEKYRA